MVLYDLDENPVESFLLHLPCSGKWLFRFKEACWYEAKDFPYHARERISAFKHGEFRNAVKARIVSREFLIRRYPCLIAHLICESLGYFTPLAAAGALQAYLLDEPCCCEWYSHISQCRGKDMFDDEEIKRIGRDILKQAIERRKSHTGYMADIRAARMAIKRELAGKGPILASWF